MPDLWFVAGIAVGTIVTGFCALGSFDRGSDSVRRRSWAHAYASRKRAVLASRATVRPTGEPNLDGVLPKAS